MNIRIDAVTKIDKEGNLVFVRCRCEEVAYIPFINARADWAVHVQKGLYVFLDLCCVEWATGEPIDQLPPAPMLASALAKIGIRI